MGRSWSRLQRGRFAESRLPVDDERGPAAPARPGSSERDARASPGSRRSRASQDGVVSRRSSACSAWSDRVVTSRELRRASGAALGPRVVALHRRRAWAATPAGGRASCTPSATDGELGRRRCARGLSAVEAGGLVGFETARGPRRGRSTGAGRRPRRSGPLRVMVHETRLFRDAGIRSRMAASASALRAGGRRVGRATCAKRTRTRRAMLAAAVQQRLAARRSTCASSAAGRAPCRAADLILRDDQRRSGRRALAAGDRAPHAWSTPAGLPEPRRQRKLQRADGTWYLDNDFADFLVTVEVNGLQHYEQTLRERTTSGAPVLQIGGRIVVDLSSYARPAPAAAARCCCIAEALIVTRLPSRRRDSRRLDRIRAVAGWRREHAARLLSEVARAMWPARSRGPRLRGATSLCGRPRAGARGRARGR